MFLISKLAAWLTMPLFWVLLLLLSAVAVMRRHTVAAHRLVIAATALLLLGGWAPLPDALLRHLERQYPDPPVLPLTQYVGVLVLGGGLESAYVDESSREPQLNSAAERMTTVLPLLRQAPGLAIVFTGGEGGLFSSGSSEAERARRFFLQQGLGADRVRFESRSRNTYENAVFTAQLDGMDPQKPWILMTSASHMPRALAVFRKQGWNVTPYSVDFRAGLTTPWTLYDYAGSQVKWESGLHEYLGILGYRISGRI
jgi:uncharacterized SAM-binding protein YcdF (DUF218 family)